MGLKAILIEDEVAGREILRNYIAKYCPELTLLGEAANITEGAELVRKHQPELVFLDVEMPYGNAFDFLELFPDREFETIFVTAYDQYAKEALNQHAAYYLMKPISIDELIKGVAYVIDVKEKEKKLLEGTGVPTTIKATGKLRVPQQQGFKLLETSTILYAEADDNYTHLHLKEGKVLASKTLKYFEEALKGGAFVRVHKSYLVNINEITEYVKGKGGHIILSSGKQLQVSAGRKGELLSYFQ
jgi:two-component system LytT family response regulator